MNIKPISDQVAIIAGVGSEGLIDFCNPKTEWIVDSQIKIAATTDTAVITVEAVASQWREKSKNHWITRDIPVAPDPPKYIISWPSFSKRMLRCSVIAVVQFLLLVVWLDGLIELAFVTCCRSEAPANRNAWCCLAFRGQCWDCSLSVGKFDYNIIGLVPSNVVAVWVASHISPVFF